MSSSDSFFQLHGKGSSKNFYLYDATMALKLFGNKRKKFTWSLYKIVVFPALSRPKIRIRTCTKSETWSKRPTHMILEAFVEVPLWIRKGVEIILRRRYPFSFFVFLQTIREGEGIESPQGPTLR
jgi:hypothetical protein